MRKLLTTLIPLVCLGMMADEPEWNFTTEPARLARKRYDLAAEKAEREHARQMSAARDAAVRELTDAKKAATRAENLDEANRINDAIKQLKSGEAPRSTGITGTWRLQFTNGATRTYVIRSNGSVAWEQNGENKTTTGRLRRDGGDVLIEGLEPKCVERLTLAGPRLFDEHFDIGKEQPVSIGVASR